MELKLDMSGEQWNTLFPTFLWYVKTTKLRYFQYKVNESIGY